MLVCIYKIYVDPKYRNEIEQDEDEVCQFYLLANGCQYSIELTSRASANLFIVQRRYSGKPLLQESVSRDWVTL